MDRTFGGGWLPLESVLKVDFFFKKLSFIN